MIAAFGLLVFIVGAVIVCALVAIDKGQRWVERVGGVAVLATAAGGLAFVGALLLWLVQFLLAHAP